LQTFFAGRERLRDNFVPACFRMELGYVWYLFDSEALISVITALIWLLLWFYSSRERYDNDVMFFSFNLR